MAKSKVRPRRAPERSCVACRARGQKRGLIRLVRTPEGQVEVDSTGRRPGRGAYLCANRACWEAALRRKALNRALRTVLTAEEVVQIARYAQTLPIADLPAGNDSPGGPSGPAAEEQ
jgi:predicted RNA-binding protein YlxR (DUF448 family)